MLLTGLSKDIQCHTIMLFSLLANHQSRLFYQQNVYVSVCGAKVPVTTIDAQWEGMGDVGSARYEPALLPPCPTIGVLSYSN